MLLKIHLVYLVTSGKIEHYRVWYATITGLVTQGAISHSLKSSEDTSSSNKQ